MASLLDPASLCRGRLYVRDQSRMACLYLCDPEHLSSEQRRTAATPAASRWDLSRLVVVEPDYPNDLPTGDEFCRWFLACLTIFGAAGLVASATALVSRSSASVPFCAVALLAGTAGTTALGHVVGTFVLTWPAALFMALQITVAVISWAERRPEAARHAARRWSRLTVVLFLTVCLGYYELCKGVGLATGWTFLTGFLPAYPLVVLVVCARRRSIWLRRRYSSSPFLATTGHPSCSSPGNLLPHRRESDVQ